MGNEVASARAKRVAPVVLPPADVNMYSVYGIESSYNPQAYNAATKAIGLGQLTPIAVADWNQMNPKQQYQHKQMYDPLLNQQVSSWYMNKRAPQLLKAYGIPDTVENRLIVYNAGISHAIGASKGKPLPLETQNYIKKYKSAQEKKRK